MSIDECAVCLSTAIPPVVLVPCSHVFCDACLRSWLPVNRTCPLCKARVCGNVVPVGARERVRAQCTTDQEREADANYVAPADGQMLSDSYIGALRCDNQFVSWPITSFAEWFHARLLEDLVRTNSVRRADSRSVATTAQQQRHSVNTRGTEFLLIQEAAYIDQDVMREVIEQTIPGEHHAE